ncbi:MAG TPA: competence protein CelA [Firmicutes bacterium]|nr:ComEA family DNA-binding protein [Bacillota bacterium]HAA34612.1 competence protein CelA [Bacillota bacterium]
MVKLFKLTPKEQKLVILLVCLLALGVVLRFVLPGHDTSLVAKKAESGSMDSAREEKEGEESPEAEKDPEDVLVVHVTGAVKNPGVYILQKGSRVFHVVEEAGGAVEEADLERINLAQPLYDGQPVHVPRKGEENSSQSYQGETPAVGMTKININTAGKSQLETLPGIGSVKAQDIISYREKNGPFQSIEELTKVSGIGEKTLERIRDLITIY